jgi:hypothetical protein
MRTLPWMIALKNRSRTRTPSEEAIQPSHLSTFSPEQILHLNLYRIIPWFKLSGWPQPLNIKCDRRKAIVLEVIAVDPQNIFLCRPKMKMSAFTKIEMSSFLEARI